VGVSGFEFIRCLVSVAVVVAGRVPAAGLAEPFPVRCLCPVGWGWGVGAPCRGSEETTPYLWGWVLGAGSGTGGQTAPRGLPWVGVVGVGVSGGVGSGCWLSFV
jgi:hypothetical protein